MTEGVRPVEPVSARDRRAADRRASERRASERLGEKPASPSRALVPLGDVVDHGPGAATAAGPSAPARPEAPGSAAAFAAQMLGQGGQRNGIRGGPPVMDAARATYLGAEYSGDRERRPPTGGAKRTEV